MEAKRRRVAKKDANFINFDLYADDSSSENATINLVDTQSVVADTVAETNVLYTQEDSQSQASIFGDSQQQGQLFTRDEFKVIVEMFFHNQQMLEGNFNESKGITKVKRKKAWQAITDAVNG